MTLLYIITISVLLGAEWASLFMFRINIPMYSLQTYIISIILQNFCLFSRHTFYLLRLIEAFNVTSKFMISQHVISTASILRLCQLLSSNTMDIIRYSIKFKYLSPDRWINIKFYDCLIILINIKKNDKWTLGLKFCWIKNKLTRFHEKNANFPIIIL